jgi:hypothetical protein
MLNANKNFFIIIRNQAFDFTAARFIQHSDSKTVSTSRVLVGRNHSLLAAARARRTAENKWRLETAAFFIAPSLT